MKKFIFKPETKKIESEKVFHIKTMEIFEANDFQATDVVVWRMWIKEKWGFLLERTTKSIISQTTFVLWAKLKVLLRCRKQNQSRISNLITSNRNIRLSFTKDNAETILNTQWWCKEPEGKMTTSSFNSVQFSSVELSSVHVLNMTNRPKDISAASYQKRPLDHSDESPNIYLFDVTFLFWLFATFSIQIWLLKKQMFIASYQISLQINAQIFGQKQAKSHFVKKMPPFYSFIFKDKLWL